MKFFVATITGVTIRVNQSLCDCNSVGCWDKYEIM